MAARPLDLASNSLTVCSATAPPTRTVKYIGGAITAVHTNKSLEKLSFDYKNFIRDCIMMWLQTTYKGQSSFVTYKQYLLWEDFMKDLRSKLASDSPLQSLFQTSDFWKQVFVHLVVVSESVALLISCDQTCLKFANLSLTYV